MKFNYYYSRRPRNRLRKRKKGMAALYQETPYQSLRVTHSSTFDKYKRGDPTWSALNRAWVGYVIAKSQCDCEEMRKYATAVRKFERRLNLAINDFPEIGIYGFEENFENKEEDDDSKLAIIDPFTSEKIQEAKEDEG